MNKDNEQREISRTLKFRVWNGAEMVYDVTVGRFGVFYVNPTNNGLDPNDSASITPFTTKYHDGTPVMQFTGLLDKNGKEIYEGDRVRILYTDWPSKSSDDPRPLHDYLNDLADKNTGEVVFVDSGWSIRFKYTDTKYAEEFYYSSIYPGKHGFIEVIGHIYSSEPIVK